jgi:hypothetical protein
MNQTICLKCQLGLRSVFLLDFFTSIFFFSFILQHWSCWKLSFVIFFTLLFKVLFRSHNLDYRFGMLGKVTKIFFQVVFLRLNIYFFIMALVKFVGVFILFINKYVFSISSFYIWMVGGHHIFSILFI